MRQAEHVGDEPVMVVQAHDHLLRHGGREQFLRLLERFGMAEIHEDHVTARQQLRIRAEHGVNRRHAHAVRLQGHEAGSQRALQ